MDVLGLVLALRLTSANVGERAGALSLYAAWDVFLKNHFRKPIEGVFSQLTDLFPRRIHAVTAKGFLLKVFLFLLAYTFDGLTPDQL